MKDRQNFRIRAAQPRDMRAVRVLCARIWSDDYIPDVFDEWVRDRRGRFWVAVEDDRVIGIAKLTLLGDHEAWLHALRVDPRHRRKGVATALLAHRVERARRLGARVARLDTQEDNTAVQRMMRRFGFRRREVDGYFERRARSIAAPRRASRADLPALARLAVGALLQDRRVARELAEPDIARATREGRCVVVGPVARPTAFAIVMPQRKSFSGSRLSVRALGGSNRGIREVMEALPGRAKEEGVSRVGISTPSRFWPALRRAGYRKRRWDLKYIFERGL
jgi:ribosomal protein S18 acetylase RimI-like enzyme